MGLSVYVGDELASSNVEVVPQRMYTLQEVDLLGRASGFEVGAAVLGLPVSLWQHMQPCHGFPAPA